MVYIHLATGFEEVEALTACDLLRRAGIETALVSVTGEKMVSGAHGIAVQADLLFAQADYEDCEMIVLPGGLPGAYGLRDHEGLRTQIRRFAAEDRPLGAICAAPLVLADCGVLQGRRATIYPGMEAELKDAVAVDATVVRDGNIITSQGPATAMRFALALIDLLRGRDVAKQVADGLLYRD